jgi:hypothetical protein
MLVYKGATRLEHLPLELVSCSYFIFFKYLDLPLLVGLELLLIDSVSQAIAENLTPLPSLLEDAIILLFPSSKATNQW